MPAFPNALGRSYTLANRITDQEATINFFAEISESKGTTSRVSFLPTPGVEEAIRVDKVGWRATWQMNGRCFGVCQDTLYEITMSGGSFVATSRGTVALDNNPATICTNGDGGGQLFITSGGNGYCYDLSTDVLTQVAALNGKATQGDYLGGYFLAFDAATSTVYFSDLLDGQTWDPTNFWQRTSQPDRWVAMKVTSWNYIFLIGEQTGEGWYPNGEVDLPFQPDPAATFVKGCAAAFSLTNAGGTLVWLSKNNDGDFEVIAAAGLEPQRISDFALETQLADYVREGLSISNAIGQSFRMQGHTWYRLTLPTTGVEKTWQFDFTSGWWTEVGTWIPEESEFTYFRPVFLCFAFNHTLAGDRESGVLYHMDVSFTSDVDGRVIRRIRRTPAVVQAQTYVFHRKLTILMQVGEDVPISGQGSNPLLMLRYSDDGGITWGNEIDLEVGELGSTSALVWFWQLGVARNRVYELSCTDPVPWKITEAYLDARRSLEAA